jgi:hypothetical protein
LKTRGVVIPVLLVTSNDTVVCTIPIGTVCVKLRRMIVADL